MERSLPSPPTEEAIKAHSTKKSNASAKSAKSTHRISKRASNPISTHSHVHSPLSPDSSSAHSMADGRHKRVWKACERCRMKKTKCDGEFPCKRCKDDGLVCTAGIRKKTEFKQLPRGYAEVLENSQFALVATVQKLYSMVRSGQQWDLGEPDLNDRGQPVIHNIAQKLGCIRPNSDIDLPVHSVFPEDEQGVADLASQLETQQQQEDSLPARHHATSESRDDRASSSELDSHSDFEDYRKVAFGGGGGGGAASSSLTLSPASLNNYDSFDSYPASEGLPSATSPSTNTFAPWMRPPPTMGFSGPQFPPSGPYVGMDMLNQGLLESEFGTIKPHVVSCRNPEVMMGLGDPMIYSGFDADALRM
ncbi:Fluconazole resistance protein 1 [Gnomoniopsis sp. IMI 355080]|nr:Fluconazole resistance protein 1 [Gnomoniopsis sp. IMI 355080]